MDYTHRPHLMTVYLPEVDQAGHKTGPDSRTIEKTLAAVDEFVREVFEEVERRNASEVVDVVVVSDHGMAGAFALSGFPSLGGLFLANWKIDLMLELRTATSNKRLIFLDDILGPSGFASISHNEGPLPRPPASALPLHSFSPFPAYSWLASHTGWPSAGLRFKPGTDVPALFARLKQAAEKEGSGFKCYDERSMLERWHFTGHEVRPRARLRFSVVGGSWETRRRG